MKIQDLRKIYMSGECSPEQLEEVKAIKLRGTDPNYRLIVKRIIKKHEVKE